MDLAHFLIRYSTASLFPIGESRADLLRCFQRNLEIRALRPAEGLTTPELLDRLTKSQYGHISELNRCLEFFDGPSWEYSTGAYEPDPLLLSKARELFDVAKLSPGWESDTMDNVMVGSWDRFLNLGKTALCVYCHDYRSAAELRESSDRRLLISDLLSRIDSHASHFVNIPDFAAIARSMRLDPARLSTPSQIPVGLLKPFCQILSNPVFGLQLADPEAWWRANERFLPDFPDEP